MLCNYTKYMLKRLSDQLCWYTKFRMKKMKHQGISRFKKRYKEKKKSHNFWYSTINQHHTLIKLSLEQTENKTRRVLHSCKLEGLVSILQYEPDKSQDKNTKLSKTLIVYKMLINPSTVKFPGTEQLINSRTGCVWESAQVRVLEGKYFICIWQGL